MDNTHKFVGSVEAGGTKFILAVQYIATGEVVARDRVATTTPQETLAKSVEFFKEHHVDALGIGTFGPIDLDEKSKTFGYITKTPKAGWSNTDVKGAFERELGVPVAITTDVNASCFGEYIARGKDDTKTYLYLTIGTGIGGGAIQAGKFVGLSAHPEMGHMFLRQKAGDDYAGNCPFHGNKCAEGLASGPTLEGRTGIRGENLDRNDPVFDTVSYYAAQLMYNLYMVLRPDEIILGGSVISSAELPKVKAYFTEFMNDYVDTPAIDTLISVPKVENNGSATLGDFELAKQLLA